MSQINKHDRYLKSLYRQVKGDYDYVYRNIPLFSKKKSLCGEIDLICFKGNHVDIFEVKCSFRLSKARRQLRKIRKVLNVESINTFFYCGMSNMIEEVT